MIVIGITGGIGSGKSVFSQLLEIMGIPVYIADVESKKLTDSSPVIREKLTERFGADLYAGGKLDKTMLASLIFENETNLRYVNSVVHPAVRDDFEQWQKQHSGSTCLAIEAAILFESGFADAVDAVIAISAPEELRIGRIENRERWSRESILARMLNQLPEEEKIRRADYVIYNDDRQALIPQTEELIKGINE